MGATDTKYFGRKDSKKITMRPPTEAGPERILAQQHAAARLAEAEGRDPYGAALIFNEMQQASMPGGGAFAPGAIPPPGMALPPLPRYDSIAGYSPHEMEEFYYDAGIGSAAPSFSQDPVGLGALQNAGLLPQGEGNTLGPSARMPMMPLAGQFAAGAGSGAAAVASAPPTTSRQPLPMQMAASLPSNADVYSRQMAASPAAWPATSQEAARAALMAQAAGRPALVGYDTFAGRERARIANAAPSYSEAARTGQRGASAYNADRFARMKAATAAERQPPAGASPESTVTSDNLEEELRKVWAMRDDERIKRQQLTENTGGRVPERLGRDRLVDKWLTGDPGGVPPTPRELAARLDQEGKNWKPERVKLAQQLHNDKEMAAQDAAYRQGTWSRNEQAAGLQHRFGLPPAMALAAVEDRMPMGPPTDQYGQSRLPMRWEPRLRSPGGETLPGAYGPGYGPNGQMPMQPWGGGVFRGGANAEMYGPHGAATLEASRGRDQALVSQEQLRNQGRMDVTRATNQAHREIAELNNAAAAARDQGNHQRAMELQAAADQRARDFETWKRTLPPEPLSPEQRVAAGVALAGSDNPAAQDRGLSMVDQATGGGHGGVGNVAGTGSNPYHRIPPRTADEVRQSALIDQMLSGQVTPALAKEFQSVIDQENLWFGPDVLGGAWGPDQIERVAAAVVNRYPTVPQARDLFLRWFYSDRGPAKTSRLGAPAVPGAPSDYKEGWAWPLNRVFTEAL